MGFQNPFDLVPWFTYIYIHFHLHESCHTFWFSADATNLLRSKKQGIFIFFINSSVILKGQAKECDSVPTVDVYLLSIPIFWAFNHIYCFQSIAHDFTCMPIVANTVLYWTVPSWQIAVRYNHCTVLLSYQLVLMFLPKLEVPDGFWM